MVHWGMKCDYSGRWQRHRTTPQERAEWVRRFERSGLTRREFAARHGLGSSTLDRWRAQSSQALASTPPPLREVSLGQVLGPAQWVAEVQRSDGWTVRVRAAALPLVAALLTTRPC